MKTFLEKDCKHSEHFSRTILPSSRWYNVGIVPFSNILLLKIWGISKLHSPVKTWEFHFQITCWAGSSFSPSFSRWIHLHLYSCDTMSVPYPAVVQSLDTLCPPALDTQTSHHPPFGAAGEVFRTRAWGSGNPTGWSILHKSHKLSEPEFPHLKYGK